MYLMVSIVFAPRPLIQLCRFLPKDQADFRGLALKGQYQAVRTALKLQQNIVQMITSLIICTRRQAGTKMNKLNELMTSTEYLLISPKRLFRDTNFLQSFSNFRSKPFARELVLRLVLTPSAPEQYIKKKQTTMFRLV